MLCLPTHCVTLPGTVFDSFFPITAPDTVQPIARSCHLDDCTSEDTSAPLSQLCWVLPLSSLVSMMTLASWSISWLLLSPVVCELSNNPVPRYFSATIFRVKFRVLSITSKAPHPVASVVPLNFGSCHPPRAPRTPPPNPGSQDMALWSFSWVSSLSQGRLS